MSTAQATEEAAQPRAFDPAEAGRKVRIRVLEALTAVRKRAQEFELPDPPEELQHALAGLSDDTYRILVVGEVKRGKSTLLNALLGRDLLPTDVGVATSQVFRISHGERDAYRVRFEDRSELEITAADLPKYGSQVFADAQGAPRLDQIIRWIEIETPFTLLPKGVSLMDTPGVGGLNSAHAEITNRFVRLADAVIFVLDSERPIGHAEIEFLRSILRRTRNVLIVQTKIDTKNREVWEQIRARHEEIIRRQVGQDLVDCRVWPISSKLLRQSATSATNAEILRVHSRHHEFARALSAFLYRVVGWSRSVDAVILGAAFCKAGANTLASRLAALEDESKRAQREYEAQLTSKQERYRTAGQEFNQIRSELTTRLTDVSRASMRRLQTELRDIERDLRGRVDQVDSVNEGRSLAEDLAEEAVRRASEAWQDAQDAGYSVYVDLLSEFLADATSDRPGRDSAAGVPGVAFGAPLAFEGDFLSRVQLARNHAINANVVAGIPAAVLVAAGVLSWPIAALGAVAAGIWGAVRGWQSGVRNEAITARNQLHNHLNRVMQDVRTHYVQAAEDFFRELDRALRERTAAVAEKVQRDAATERDHLVRDKKLTDQQRHDAAIRLRQQAVAWRHLEQQLATIQTDLVADQQRMAAMTQRKG
jgi:GTPase SAR1 family protein